MLQERKRLYALVALITYIIILPVVARVSHAPGGLPGVFHYLETEIAAAPFAITFDMQTLSVCAKFSLMYLLLCSGLIMNMKNYRSGEEYGSAKFGNKYKLNKYYKCREAADGLCAKLRNCHFTEKVLIGLDWIRHEKNLNTLIIGGAGTGKSRGFIFPNLLRANCSYVVTDSKGELLTKIGMFLFKIMGYKIRILDLKNPEKGHCYNPFVYFRNDEDIFKYVEQSWEAMSDKTAMKGEQIWDDQAKNMYKSLVMYLYHYAPKDEQNMDMVLRLIKEIKASEGPKKELSAVDILFSRIDKNSATYGCYKMWAAAQGRTLSSILATLTAKLTAFNLDSIRKMTMCDELNFRELATEKVALFAVLPDNHTTFNFIAGIMYSQLIQTLYDYADNVCRGPLPRHVRFLMDEFANVALPDDYQKILSTSRGRNISFTIVLQNKSQIEALYEKVYQSIIGNCDEILFLGSSELETCKYFSELLDNETVVVRTTNVTKGFHGSTTVNETKAARALMTPGELRKLNNRKCVLLIRGEDPVIDYKINLKRCKNYKYMADGKRTKKNTYDWGRTDRSWGSMEAIPAGYAGYITPLPDTDAKLVA